MTRYILLLALALVAAQAAQPKIGQKTVVQADSGQGFATNLTVVTNLTLQGTGSRTTYGATNVVDGAGDNKLVIGNGGAAAYNLTVSNSVAVGSVGVDASGNMTLTADATKSLTVGATADLSADAMLWRESSSSKLKPVTVSGGSFSAGTLTITGLPTSGQYDGAVISPWVGTNGVITQTWRKAPIVEEFMANTTIFGTAGFTANSGAVSMPASGVDAIEPGIASISTGANAAGVAGIGGSGLALQSIVFGTNSMTVMWRIKTPSTLSTDVDIYALFAGLGDATSAVSPTDGAYFLYTHSLSNGVWTAITASNSNTNFASGASSTVTVAAATWYNLRLEGNKDVVNFWVSADDGVTWTWLGFSSSNIVTTLARNTGVECYIRKLGGSTGTTPCIAYIGRFTYWAPRLN